MMANRRLPADARAALDAYLAPLPWLVQGAPSPTCGHAATRLDDQPLPGDEPCVATWVAYLEESRRSGVLSTLREHIVQLRCGVRAGISRTAEYRAATRQGRGDLDLGPPVALERPDALVLHLAESGAGRVPVLLAGTRGDFVTLYRALSARNEPVAVPGAVGACLVSGLVNWHRVRAWHEAHPADGWASARARLSADKPAYQDRFVLMAPGPYSGVPAREVGLDGPAWLERSRTLRLEHELAHYVVLRMTGRLRSHVLDEIVADYAAIMQASGRYDATLARRFLGIEAGSALRPGARLRVYLDEARLPEAAERAAIDLAILAIDALAALDPPATRTDLARRILWCHARGLPRLADGGSEHPT